MLCAIFAVKFRVDVQKRFGGLLGEPYDQLVAEARPGRGKALLCAGVLRTGAVGVLAALAAAALLAMGRRRVAQAS